jgi:hypothetical protein
VTLEELIQRNLDRSTEADPHTIARRLIPRLSPLHKSQILTDGLAELVREQIRLARMTPPNQRTGPSKWKNAAAERVWTGERWMMLDDCGIAELNAIALNYEILAAQNAAKAVEYHTLAKALERSGYKTVGEMREALSEAS